MAVAAGTLFFITAHYDNTLNNAENPNYPLRDIHPGEKTTDETCIAFVKHTLDAENREPSSPEASEVSVDSDGKLVVRGRGFSAGRVAV